MSMIRIAFRNLRGYLGKASFAMEVDRQAALNCVEVIEMELHKRTECASPPPCEHDWQFVNEESDGRSALFQCSICGQEQETRPTVPPRNPG